MTTGSLAETKIYNEVLGDIPLKKIAQPEEIAGPVLFLASNLASHITGEILNVNGGSVASSVSSCSSSCSISSFCSGFSSSVKQKGHASYCFGGFEERTVNIIGSAISLRHFGLGQISIKDSSDNISASRTFFDMSCPVLHI